MNLPASAAAATVTMLPYQSTLQSPTLAATGSIKDHHHVKYPNFDLTASFLAPYPGTSLISKAAPVNGGSQPAIGNGVSMAPIKGLYIIDQNKNIRKLTLPANPSATQSTQSPPSTSTSSSSISSATSNSSSSSSSAPTTPHIPCMQAPAYSNSFDPTANASLLLSSLIHHQSQSTAATPTKNHHALAPNPYVPAQLVDFYAAGSMCNNVAAARKRRKQDLSIGSPVMPTGLLAPMNGALANGVNGGCMNIHQHVKGGSMLYPTTASSAASAMADLTNSNGAAFSLLTSSHMHHVAALNGLAKQFQRSMSSNLNCGIPPNESTGSCQLEAISPPASHHHRHAVDFSYHGNGHSSLYHSMVMDGNGGDDFSYQTNSSPSFSHLSPLLVENEVSMLDDETVLNLSKEFRYVGNNGLSWSAKKCKSHVAIAKTYKPAWKSRSHHYQKYSDIKAKDSTGRVASSITTRELDESLNEWKLHYVIGQVNNLINYENESMSLINDVEAMIESMKEYSSAVNRDLFGKLNDSIKANHMRHRYVNEQLEEAHLLIHKLFEHKDKFKTVLIENATAKTNELTTTSTLDNDTSDTSNLHHHQCSSSSPSVAAAGLYSGQEHVTAPSDENKASSTSKQQQQQSSLQRSRNLKKSMNTRTQSKRPS